MTSRVCALFVPLVRLTVTLMRSPVGLFYRERIAARKCVCRARKLRQFRVVALV